MSKAVWVLVGLIAFFLFSACLVRSPRDYEGSKEPSSVMITKIQTAHVSTTPRTAGAS